MKILDLFCSNGSTWYDKKYFNTNVIKNDLRKGNYKKLSSNPQILEINPDFQVDVLNKIIVPGELPQSNYIYVDPPHLVNATGIMFDTYGTLFDDWSWQLDNLVENLNILSTGIVIFKWNNRCISIKNIITKMNKYFVPGIKFELPKTHNTSYMIIFIKR